MTAIEQIASDLDDIQTPIARARHLARAIRMMAAGDEMEAEPGDATWTVANSLLEILDGSKKRAEIWRLALEEKRAPKACRQRSAQRLAHCRRRSTRRWGSGMRR